MPILFTSHGAPDIALTENKTTQFWREWGTHFSAPRHIVVVSAHWCTTDLMVGAHPQPPTVHDFGGFDPALYQMQYRTIGDSAFATRLAAHTGATLSATQGLDHGMWIPLRYLHAGGDCPVIPLSLPTSFTPQQLMDLGNLLSNTLDDNDWLICSGATSHNLRAIFSPPSDGDTRVAAFTTWLQQHVSSHDLDALAHYREQAPDAKWNHPTDEHLRPLFVALGAATGRALRITRSEICYRLLPMDHFSWT